jgi:hypothetical protein
MSQAGCETWVLNATRQHSARMTFSAEILRDLTAEDLEGLWVVSIGHRRQLLVAIAKLRDDAGSLEPVRPAIDDHLASTSVAERRPLSVMFCDLVGSTVLSSRLDADQIYARAIAAGAHSIEEPTVMPWGDRRATVSDDWGNLWQIATQNPATRS